MQEIVLYYHIDEEVKIVIKTILDQLDVKMKEILPEDASQQMGYLLDIPGYDRQDQPVGDQLEDSFLFFAHFSDKQLDVLLEIFKNAKIPYIPYKAMLTNDNVIYTFEQLYHNVEHEYKQITGQLTDE